MGDSLPPVIFLKEDDWWHQAWSEGSQAPDLGNPMVPEFIQSMVM
jgi:hypothetical protein